MGIHKLWCLGQISLGITSCYSPSPRQGFHKTQNHTEDAKRPCSKDLCLSLFNLVFPKIIYKGSLFLMEYLLSLPGPFCPTGYTLWNSALTFEGKGMSLTLSLPLRCEEKRGLGPTLDLLSTPATPGTEHPSHRLANGFPPLPLTYGRSAKSKEFLNACSRL